MTCLRPHLVAAALLVATLGLGLPASAAQAHDPAAAEALFLAGRDAVTRGDYATACPKFAESNRLDPAAGTLINLADCEEHTGAIAAAWDHWKEAVELLPTDDARRPIAQQRATAVEKRVPRLAIKLASGSPVDTRIMRDDVEVGIASLSIALPENPGAHVIVVTAPGRLERRFSVTLAEGQSQEIVVAPGDVDPHAVAPGQAFAATPEKPVAPLNTRPLGFVVGAVGVMGLGVGVTTGFLALGKKNALSQNCNPATVCNAQGADDASAGHAYATISTVTFIAGAAVTAAGLYLVLSSPHRSGSVLAVAPEVGPAGGGLRLVRSF